MSKRKGERILGPYEQHNGWRVIEVYADGSRKSTLLDSEQKARRLVDALEAELVRTDHTTETAGAEWIAWLRSSVTRGERAIKIAEWSLARFFPDPLPLAAITKRKGEDLYKRLCSAPVARNAFGKTLAPESQRTALRDARCFLTWCVSQRWIAENPLAEIEPEGKTRPRGKTLGKSGTELARFRDARAWYFKALEMGEAGDEGAIAALVALVLGMRATEIVTRLVSDLDEDTEPGDLLWIPCSKTEAGRRTLEVPDPLRSMLVRLVEGKALDRYVFEAAPPHEGEPSKPHLRDWVRQQVHRVCKRAGLPNVTAHAMRSALSTLTAERGTAGRVLAATLGHEQTAGFSPVTARHYVAPGAIQRGTTRAGMQVLNGGLSKAAAK